MRPYVLLTLAPLLWSGNWLIGRGLHETMTPIGLNFGRWTVAVVLLAVIVAPNWRHSRKLYAKHWRLLVVLGLLGIVIFQILIYIGLRYTSVINAVVLNSTMPIFMVFTSWLMLGETISWRQAFGGLVSFSGILAIVSRGDWETLLGIEFGTGDLLILLAMPVWAVYSGILRRADTGLNGIETLAGMSLAALVIMAPAFLVDVAVYDNPMPTDAGSLSAIAYVGVFAGVGAFYCWNEGVRGAGPAIAGFMYHLLPAFASIGAVILLGERLFAYQIVGIALILAGVYMSTRNAEIDRLPRA